MTHDDNDEETELQLVYRNFACLRKSHTELLAAAKKAVLAIDALTHLRQSHTELLAAAQYIYHVCKNGEDQGGELDAALKELGAAIAKAEQI